MALGLARGGRPPVLSQPHPRPASVSLLGTRLCPVKGPRESPITPRPLSIQGHKVGLRHTEFCKPATLALSPSADLSSKNHSPVRVCPGAWCPRGIMPASGLCAVDAGRGRAQGVPPGCSRVTLQRESSQLSAWGPEGCDPLWGSPGSGARLSPCDGRPRVPCTRAGHASSAVKGAPCEHMHDTVWITAAGDRGRCPRGSLTGRLGCLFLPPHGRSSPRSRVPARGVSRLLMGQSASSEHVSAEAARIEPRPQPVAQCPSEAEPGCCGAGE